MPNRSIVILSLVALTAACLALGCPAKTDLDVTEAPLADGKSAAEPGGAYCVYEGRTNTVCGEGEPEEGDWEAFCYAGWDECSYLSLMKPYDCDDDCCTSYDYRKVVWADTCPDGVDSEGNCAPSCKGKECGTDGCDGDCGECDKDSVCVDGVCESDCECEKGEFECEEGIFKHCNDGCYLEVKPCTEVCEAAGYDSSEGCKSDASGDQEVCDCRKEGGFGIGDPCLVGDECTSGICAAEDGAWCTDECLTYEDCAGDFVDKLNANGFLNTCIPSAAGVYMCFPKCNGNPDCSVYPNSVCQLALSSLGIQELVCTR